MLNKTIVFITHDFLEALKLADRIAVMRDGQIVQIGTPAEIVLKPADGYVAEFTEDVPLTRVIRAADLMETPGPDLAPGSETHPETTLEDLLPRFAHHEAPVAVMDGLGTVVGQVTARGVVRALAENAAQRHR
jgi:glycine betaine/proline transport system ATP-binding protein